MQTDKRAQRVLFGSERNLRFEDLAGVAEQLGFTLVRRRGSHWAYRHPDVPELLVLQPDRGQAKPYQVRQLRLLVRAYNLIRGEQDV